MRLKYVYDTNVLYAIELNIRQDLGAYSKNVMCQSAKNQLDLTVLSMTAKVYRKSTLKLSLTKFTCERKWVRQ